MTKQQGKQRGEVSLLSQGQILPQAPGSSRGHSQGGAEGSWQMRLGSAASLSPATGNQVSANTARGRQQQAALWTFPLTGLEERRQDPLWGLGS